MQSPLNASASSAGKLISSYTFLVPAFQREFSWEREEVSEFWRDLQESLEEDSYFLGLIILSDRDDRKFIVDGQQRLITVSLLAAAIKAEAEKSERRALADKIQSDFLTEIDFATDLSKPRVLLTDQEDNKTFQTIIKTGEPPVLIEGEEESVSKAICNSYEFLREKLRDDLSRDPFKRLGKWADFLTNRLYFAVFLHPEDASAYKVYEVVNTRGKDLTTADLLKNFVLSQVGVDFRDDVYSRWKAIAKQFTNDGAAFVQFIRHSVTVDSGHILPKDLYEFLAGRKNQSIKRQSKGNSLERTPPTARELVSLLEKRIPFYRQMIDPTLPGPASEFELGVYEALNSLGVIAVRPILLSIAELPNKDSAIEYILRLVVRRVVAGSLGTGNVERRFGEAAREVFRTKKMDSLQVALADLNPSKGDFEDRILRRGFKKGVMAFLRSSILQNTTVPKDGGTLHYIWLQQFPEWDDLTTHEDMMWGGTIGNTYLSNSDMRPTGTDSWEGVRLHLLPTGVAGEIERDLNQIRVWNKASIENVGLSLAKRAVGIWY